MTHLEILEIGNLFWAFFSCDNTATDMSKHISSFKTKIGLHLLRMPLIGHLSNTQTVLILHDLYLLDSF